MRLTLRTLLAYLDDILEPSQAKEIGQKLNESGLASSLVSRIKEVMRRRRLTAPTLSGPGVGVDPNTVAEYLDNTLPPDGVADVEKICLESDVHLAEVAACHQILTLALGEPVEVSQRTRERMYALGPAARNMVLTGVAGGGATEELAGAAVDDVLRQAESIARDARPGDAPANVSPGPAARVLPEYLRPQTQWKTPLLYAAVVAVAGIWAYFTFQGTPFRSTKGSSPAAVADRAEDRSQAAGKHVVAADEGREPAHADAAAADRTAPAERDRAAAVASNARPAPSIDPEPPEDQPDDGEARFQRKSTAAPPPAATASTEPTAPRDKPAAPAAPEAPPAKYVSQEGISLQFVPREDGWFVLPPRSQIHPGDLLAVPEPFECALELGDSGTLLTFPGRSMIRWLGPNEFGATGVELRRGQLVVRTRSAGPENAETRILGLMLGGRLWKLEVMPGTICGIDLLPLEPSKFEQRPAGNDYAGGVYVSTGEVWLTDPDSKSTHLRGPGWFKLPAGPTPQLLATPEWLAPQPLKGVSEQLARQFEKKFNPDESVDLSLPAVAEDPNARLSKRATDCLGLIEAYRPLVAVMQRTIHDESRRAAIAGLRQWLPRADENRDRLKEELARIYSPDDAEIVYKLLWGYDAADLRDKNTSLQLLAWMEHPEVSIRELAFSYVFRFVDKTHDYRASANPLRLQSALLRWRQHVAKEGAFLPPATGDQGE